MKAGICETLREVGEAIASGGSFTTAMGNFMAFLKPERINDAIADMRSGAVAGRCIIELP